MRFKAYVLSAITFTTLWFTQAFAAVDIEKSYPFNLDDKKATIHQKILSGNAVPLRFFHITADADTSGKTPIIFLPDLSRGTNITEAMQSYLSDLLTYILPHLGVRDIYIFPGRTLEGGYLHNCDIELGDWAGEFVSWAGTNRGVRNCIRQLGAFNLKMSDFSTEEMVSDLTLLVKDENLKKPIIWSLLDLSIPAIKFAEEQSKLLGGLILDHPDTSYLKEASDSFEQFLGRIDKLAEERDWQGKEAPSFYLKEAIETHNNEGIYKADISDIAFVEDINRILPVNIDALNYYLLAKADQPNFLTQLSLDADTAIIYNQFPSFSIESYSSITGLPERYRKCTQLQSFKQNVEKTPALLKETFMRDYKRQETICAAIGADKLPEIPIVKNTIKTPTMVIVGELDPYFSQTAFDVYTSQFKNLGVIRWKDGSIGTPECMDEPMEKLSADLTSFIDGKKPITEERNCDWSFAPAEDTEASN